MIDYWINLMLYWFEVIMDGDFDELIGVFVIEY